MHSWKGSLWNTFYLHPYPLVGPFLGSSKEAAAPFPRKKIQGYWGYPCGHMYLTALGRDGSTNGFPLRDRFLLS